MTQLAPPPVFRAWDNLGLPLFGGKLFSYIAGTTTKQATYTDSTGGTPNTNPVILNARGEANVWLDPSKVYKLVLAPATDTDPPSNPFWTVDNISGGALSPSGSIIPTVDNTFTLGNTSFSWANVYVGPNHAPLLDTVSGNLGYYKQTQTEINAGVTPLNFSYPPGNVFRYYTAAQITQTVSFSTSPSLDCSAAINNAVKATTGDVFFPTGIHYINAPIYIPSTAQANVRFVGESRTNTKIEPMANNIADALNINAMIINQATNEKFSMYRIRCTTGDYAAVTAWAGFSVHAVQRAAWSAAVNYVAGALVTSGGNSYVCILANINQVPPNASFWLLCGTNGAGYTAAGCDYIFSGSIRDCWFDAGGVQPMFVGGLNNYHVTDNTFEFQKGCFSITGGTADVHWVSNSLNACFDYFLQMTQSPNANQFSVKGVHAVGHNRGLLFNFQNAWSFVIEDIHLQGSTGGSNLGSIGIGTFAACTDFEISDCIVITNGTLGTGATATQLTFQACFGQVSDCVLDGCDIGILLTGTAANRLSFDHVDIVNTLTASMRVQTGTPSGVVQVSSCNWSDGGTDLILFSNAAAFDFFINDCRFLNAGLTAGAGARNLIINTTGTVRISDCQIGQNNGSAAAGFYIQADGAGPGVFEVQDPKFIGTPPTGINTGAQTIVFDGITGTWTPSVGGTATYTTQQGTYSVNGKCVSFWGRLTINVIGTGNQTTISGLPFVNNATYYGSGVAPFFASIATAVTELMLTVAPSSSQILFRSLTAAATSTGTSNILQNGADVIFGGSYQLP